MDRARGVTDLGHHVVHQRARCMGAYVLDLIPTQQPIRPSSVLQKQHQLVVLQQHYTLVHQRMCREYIFNFTQFDTKSVDFHLVVDAADEMIRALALVQTLHQVACFVGVATAEGVGDEDLMGGWEVGGGKRVRLGMKT